MNNLPLLVVLLFVLVLISCNRPNLETFNDYTGTYCTTCNNRTINSCNKCFNCGILEDQYGNQWCVRGDVNGPYNYKMDASSRWKHADTYAHKLQQVGRKRRCSDGPSNATRALGVSGL